jgi:hypothetical protein
MRTVVVEHRGQRRYLHLLFAKDAPAGTMGQGPVTVEFFAGDDAEGPARLLLPGGRTLWAFTGRLGEVARPSSAAGRRSDTRPDTRPGSRPETAGNTSSGSTSDGGAGLMVPAIVHGTGPRDGRDGRGEPEPSGTEPSGTGLPGTGPSGTGSSGAGSHDSVWSGGDGWTGGSSWGGDPTWTGSDGVGGGGHTGGGSDSGGGGWFGGGGDSGGWSGGDSGGGGGDSGGGGS